MIADETLEACKAEIRARPEWFRPGVRVAIKGPSVGNPSLNDDFYYAPPIMSSEALRSEILRAMGVEHGKVTAIIEDLAHGETAAVFFTSNLVAGLPATKWMRIICRGDSFHDTGQKTDASPRLPTPPTSRQKCDDMGRRHPELLLPTSSVSACSATATRSDAAFQASSA